MADSADNKPRMQRRWVVLAALVLLALIFLIPFIRDGGARVDTSIEVETVQAISGRIRETVSGTGRVESMESQSMAAPSAGVLASWSASEGDRVNEGDVIALYDPDSLLPLMEEVLDEIEALDEQIQSLGEQTDFTLTAEEDGLVKMLSAQRGSPSEGGVLAVLSTDGLLKVTFTPEEGVELEKDETVRVVLERNKAEGTVTAVEEGKVTVTFPDGAEWPLDEEVELKDSKGKLLGKGSIEVNQPWTLECERVGVISGVSCEIGDQVEEGDSLFTCIDLGEESDCQTLVQQRQAAVERYLLLRDFQQKPEVVAEATGILADCDPEAGAEVKEGQQLCRIVSEERCIVSLEIPAREGYRVQEGQTVELSFESGRGTGVVSRSLTKEELDGATCNVTVAMQQGTGHQPGEKLTGEIVLQEHKDAVLIPIKTVSFQQDGSETVEVAYGDGLTHSRDVVTGLRSGSYVEVVQGLEVGDAVVVSSRTVETTVFSLLNHEWVLGQREEPTEDSAADQPTTENTAE